MDPSALWSLSHGTDAADTVRAHDVIKSEPTPWEQLAFTGLFDAGDTILEQRTCPACGSSLGRLVAAARIDRLLAGASRVLHVSLEAVASVRGRPPRPVIAVCSERPVSDDETRPHRMLDERTTAIPLRIAAACAGQAA